MHPPLSINYSLRPQSVAAGRQRSGEPAPLKNFWCRLRRPLDDSLQKLRARVVLKFPALVFWAADLAGETPHTPVSPASVYIFEATHWTGLEEGMHIQ